MFFQGAKGIVSRRIQVRQFTDDFLEGFQSVEVGQFDLGFVFRELCFVITGDSAPRIPWRCQWRARSVYKRQSVVSRNENPGV